MNVESWSGRSNKVLVIIPSVGHLRCDKFRQNCKYSDFVNQTSDKISYNIEKNVCSNVIHSFHYLNDNFKDEFISAVGDAGFNFSNQISHVETISMMSDDG